MLRDAMFRKWNSLMLSMYAGFTGMSEKQNVHSTRDEAFMCQCYLHSCKQWDKLYVNTHNTVHIP